MLAPFFAYNEKNELVYTKIGDKEEWFYYENDNKVFYKNSDGYFLRRYYNSNNELSRAEDSNGIVYNYIQDRSLRC